MLEVDLHNIISEDNALQRLTEIFANVEANKQPYILTKNGHPSVAIIDIATLEKTQQVGVMTPLTPESTFPDVSMNSATTSFAPAPATASTPEPIPMSTPVPTEPVASFSMPTDLPTTPVTPVAPVPSTETPTTFNPPAPTTSGNDLPDMPEDPTNSSPLA